MCMALSRNEISGMFGVRMMWFSISWRASPVGSRSSFVEMFLKRLFMVRSRQRASSSIVPKCSSGLGSSSKTYLFFLVWTQSITSFGNCFNLTFAVAKCSKTSGGLFPAVSLFLYSQSAKRTPPLGKVTAMSMSWIFVCIISSLTHPPTRKTCPSNSEPLIISASALHIRL